MKSVHSLSDTVKNCPMAVLPVLSMLRVIIVGKHPVRRAAGEKKKGKAKRVSQCAVVKG